MAKPPARPILSEFPSLIYSALPDARRSDARRPRGWADPVRDRAGPVGRRLPLPPVPGQRAPDERPGGRGEGRARAGPGPPAAGCEGAGPARGRLLPARRLPPRHRDLGSAREGLPTRRDPPREPLARAAQDG